MSTRPRRRGDRRRGRGGRRHALAVSGAVSKGDGYCSLSRRRHRRSGRRDGTPPQCGVRGASRRATAAMVPAVHDVHQRLNERCRASRRSKVTPSQSVESRSLATDVQPSAPVPVARGRTHHLVLSVIPLADRRGAVQPGPVGLGGLRSAVLLGMPFGASGGACAGRIVIPLRLAWFAQPPAAIPAFTGRPGLQRMTVVQRHGAGGRRGPDAPVHHDSVPQDVSSS